MAGGTGVLHNFALGLTLQMCPPAKQGLGWVNMRSDLREARREHQRALRLLRDLLEGHGQSPHRTGEAALNEVV